MKKVLLLLPAVSVMELTSGVIHAQPQTEISIGGDLVSTYVWRGVYQSGFSLQPEIGLSVGGFTVGVWGSTDLDNFKEVDLSVGYSVRGFSVGVTDYWWGGQRLGDGRFAPYFKYGDTHYFEGTLAYEFGEKFRGARCSPGPIKKKTVIGLGRLTWSLPIRFLWVRSN